jgi:hypothetical protein
MSRSELIQVIAEFGVMILNTAGDLQADDDVGQL